MTFLREYVSSQKRFGRSANVERDSGTEGILGYVPTGRAIDVVDRIAAGLGDSASGRTFSITGPHGGGKSSLAVFLSALLSPQRSAEFRSSHALLRDADKAIDSRLTAGLREVGSLRDGFVTAVATARAESVATTVGRALYVGAVRAFGESQEFVPASFASSGGDDGPTENNVRDAVRRLCAVRPMILIIDEFGKNLESYAQSLNLGDPYLLQELAESTQGANALPLVIVTMQHLAFDEYVQDSSAARRREWAKVQGRFQDIPYVETSDQARRLITASLKQSRAELQHAADNWVRLNSEAFESLNLKHLLSDAAGAFPLHPVALAALPDLCARYGQNERTLFSFIAGTEPLGVQAFLETTEWEPEQAVPLVGLDRVYDYFLDSVASMIGVSENASRWVEIETRIRDSAGLSEAELRAVKTVGVLNLVSSGGQVRASRAMLEFSLRTGESGTKTKKQIGAVLDGLERRGLLVYRTFSDEYRVWQGSDYDLRRAVDSARRQCLDMSLPTLLNDAAEPEPAVAGRHSQRTGVLRIFGQRFSDLAAHEPMNPDWDGLVVYATSSGTDDAVFTDDAQDGRPVIVVAPEDVSSLREAAVEAAALKLALRSAEEENADWVAKRELTERTAAGQHQLRQAIARTWNAGADWRLVGSEKELRAEGGLSSVLSAVADSVFTDTPRVANEMIAKRELTSQGAKARRILIDAMIENPTIEAFGLEGYGPERAIYEAVFRATGIHRADEIEGWKLSRPKDRFWKNAWAAIDSAFDDADESRTSLAEVMRVLTLPPIGLKDGVMPLLAIAALLARADDIALYEHGSLVLSLDDAVSERLAKNPSHFAVRNSGTRGASRKAVVDALADRMGIRGRRDDRPTFLNVTTAIFRELRLLPPFVQKTKSAVSSEAVLVREAFHTASEPDVLIFETLPQILGFRPFRVRGKTNTSEAAEYASKLAEVVLELRGSYDQLLDQVREKLAGSTSLPGTDDLQSRLAARANELDGKVLEPRLKAFVGALGRPLDEQSWLENVAMVLAEGQAPRVWTDDVAARFPLRVAELGGAMRRTEALLYERLAQSDSPGAFTASRITLTRPDGSEWNEIVSISEEQILSIDKKLEPLFEELMKDGGSRGAVCRMLMARLAVEELGSPSSDEQGGNGKVVKHG